MGKIDLIAIGASTGGTEAIYSLLSLLPKEVPPILVVQHMPAGFTGKYAERLNNSCRMEVREGADYERIQSGLCLIAPGGFQMSLISRSRDFFVRVKQEEKVNGHAPSVDVLFNSIASVFTGNACGVLLTGMGNDGAAGLYNMRSRGFLTFGQNEASSVVYGMPKVAFEKGAVIFQGSPEEIAKKIIINI